GEKHASIPKSGLEIKNRCTLEGLNGEKPASILKFGLEIKNRCTLEGLNEENPALIRKSGLEIKNRYTKQPIFSTHPQTSPSSSPSTRSSRGEARVLPWMFCMGWARAGSSRFDSGGESGC
ncbi:MAG: hypothetical protein SOV31_06830, partial [Candidatus Cryptobacteroides sp.]|nr:hypothetical protein [Candidatus Cryptobacteroides sp.]